jgi:hypothetical protein
MRTARILFVVGGAALWGCATEKPAGPQQKTYDVTLSKAAEATLCAAAGANAAGAATVTLAADDSTISVTVTYSGLSGDVTASHIHAGAPGANGPVVLPFSAPLTSPFSKVFNAADYTAASGAPPNFAAFVAGLRAGGGGYINVHTAACKPGEIRGDIK